MTIMQSIFYLNRIRFINVLLLLAILAYGCSNDDDPSPDVVTPEEPTPTATILKDKARFGIGAAITSTQLNESAFASTLSGHFNQITAEYEMKMAKIWTSENSFNWTNGDALVDFAKQKGMKVHGHALVWYNSMPEWFKNANYDTLTYEAKVKDYITTTVKHYKDKGNVVSWDVANEIFSEDGTMRVEGVINGKFNDPIAFYGRCFQYVRDVDPNVKLFYNDYNVVLNSAKRAGIIKLVKRFQKDGYPIDGIGDQFHYTVTTSKEVMKTGLNDMASTGLLVHISELDLRVNVQKADDYLFTNSEKAIQSQAYQSIVEMYEALPDKQKFAITLWGVTDKYTWLTGWWHPKEYPLLFDSNFNKKPAYDGFLKGLK